MSKRPTSPDANNRIVAVTLDEELIGRSGPDIEHERAIAIYDLVEKNLVAPEGDHAGPFTLHIGITGNRLMFDIRREGGEPVIAHLMSLTPFRRIVKDYFMICDSYYQAIRTATPDRIEVLYMGRRGNFVVASPEPSSAIMTSKPLSSCRASDRKTASSASSGYRRNDEKSSATDALSPQPLADVGCADKPLGPVRPSMLTWALPCLNGLHQIMQKISAYILSYNEAEKIEAAMSSVLWADEVVVVDLFSTDRTAQIAWHLRLARELSTCLSRVLAICAIVR